MLAPASRPPHRGRHLRHLFEKTGTQRQADLVKLVAGFAAPAG